VAISPDGRCFASASADQTIKLWDASNRKELLTIRGHESAVNDVAFSPGGASLASAGADGTVKVWSVSNGTQIVSFRGYAGDGALFKMDPSLLKRYDLTLPTNGPIQTPPRQSGAPGEQVLPAPGAGATPEASRVGANEDGVIAVSFSVDGKVLASLSRNGLLICEATTGQVIRQSSEVDAKRYNNVAFSRDGLLMAIPRHGTRLATIEFLNPKTADVVEEVTDYFSELGQLFVGCTRVAFSADSRWFAAGNHLGHVRIAKMPGGFHQLASYLFSGAPRVKRWLESDYITFSAHIGSVTGLVFSPEGNRLASSSEDGTIKIWDAKSGQEILTLRGHTGGVNSVAFSPDGQRLISGGTDGTVRIWDATPAGFQSAKRAP